MKIAFCVPCFESPKFGFFKSFSDLLVAMRDYPAELRLFAVSGFDIVTARNLLAENAIKWGADWLQWFDSDHCFPPDATLRLLAHDKPLVACNYAKRRGPEKQVARTTGLDGPIWTTKKKADAGLLEPAGLSGFGMALIAAEVFGAIERPWFLQTWNEHGRPVLCEDEYFFSKAAAAGYTLLIDHALSWASVHIDYETLLHCAQGRPMDAGIENILSNPATAPEVATILRALKAR